MHRLTLRVSICFLACLVSACSVLPRLPSKVDTHTVYAWPLDRCPSVPAPTLVERAGLLFGPLGNVLGSTFISALVGIPGAALTEAAQADASGFTSTGTNARFYYRASSDQNGVLRVLPPGCYVVAYSRIDAGAKAWCDDEKFSGGASASCANGKNLVHGLSAKDHLKDQLELVTKPLAIPEFYAEIGLESSGTKGIVRPRVAALYYPKAMQSRWFHSKRTVSISLTITSPVPGADALKGASLALVMPGVTPGIKLADDALVNVNTAWSGLPDFTSGATMDKEGSYVPITITATLTEVGDPNRFLASFAKAFNASASDISKTLSSALLPAGQLAAEQQASSNVAVYNSAHSAALKSNADYLAACAKAPATESEKQSAYALFVAVIASRQKANIAARTAELPPPFASDGEPPTRCF